MKDDPQSSGSQDNQSPERYVYNLHLCLHLHIVLNTGHTVVGIFKLTFLLHFDQKNIKKIYF